MTNCEIKFKQIFESERYHDVCHLSDARILTDDGCSFDIHKIILAMSSDFFRAMFSKKYKSENEYRISNINGKCMSDILRYIYTNDIYMTQMNVKDLLIGSDYFLLKELYTKLKQYVKKNITDANCLKLYYTAYQLNDSEIFQHSFVYIQKRFEMIFVNYNNDLVDFPSELLKNILSNRNLNVQSENFVWKAISHWTKSCSATRLSAVPNLLSALAIGEIGEDLATEILNHDIVKKNFHMKSLKHFADFGNFGSNRALLKNYLEKNLIDCKLQKFRIPRKLNVISKFIPGYGETGTTEIYISYDETHSLWRKITNVNFEPEYLTAIGSDLHIFQKYGPRCVKFNLIKMKWKPMQNFNYFGHTVFAIENCIYILGLNNNGTYDVKVYNVERNMWFRIASLKNACSASAVVLGKKILAVGLNQALDGMVAQILNPLNHQWILISSPKIIRSHFELVAYNGKIYLIGGFNGVNETILTVEVYDPETDVWMELPDLPITYSWVAATILNDQMILYDFASMLTKYEPTSTAVRWNETEKCWEKLQKSNLPGNMHQYRMCSVFDVETIKFLTKQNRNPEANLEKCPLNCE